MATVVISGASAGFGAEAARRLVEAGHKVVAIARRAERLERLKEECGPDLFTLALDISDLSSVKNIHTSLPWNCNQKINELSAS